MTPKQKVMKKFPNAKAEKSGTTWSVKVGKWTRFGTTAADAWHRASVMQPILSASPRAKEGA